MTSISVSDFATPEKLIVWNECILTIGMKVIMLLDLQFIIMLPAVTQLYINIQILVR
jgi:hypothetical protein